MTQNRIRKQVHLGAHFPGVNNTTVWTDPASKSQIEFSSFEHLARSAERGLFDFFFLAEGLRLREHQGKIHDLDVVGRPDTFSILNAVAGVTTHLGLAGTINTTFNEPYELAKQFSTLDHLSDGRAAWNLVTSSDAFTGENFRRGGYLEHSERYARANELVDAVRTLWDSWSIDRPIVDRERGVLPPTSRSVSSTTPVSSSTSPDASKFLGVPKGTQFCCRQVIPTKDASSAPPRRTRSSPGTERSKQARRSTPT